MWIKQIGVLAVMIGFVEVQACEISNLRLTPVTTASPYNIFSSAPVALQQDIHISASISTPECEIAVNLSMADGSQALQSSEGGRLMFDWSGAGGQLSGVHWLIRLSHSQPEAIIGLRFSGQQWLAAGEYRNEIEATLAAQNEPIALLPIAVSVAPVTKIQFYGIAADQYALDMGTLTTGKKITSPRLWVQSNTGYTVRIDSQHQGALRHQSDSAQWDIPYTLSIADYTVDLAQEDARLAWTQPTPGQILPITFIIGDTQHKPGGQYADTLQISIEPRLTQQ